MNANDVKNYLEEGSAIRNSLDIGKILGLGNALSRTFKNGNKLIIFGNGGSAADAQHIAAEFMGRFEREREPLPALILHGNASSMTAIGNDYGFDQVYSRQIKAIANEKDLLIALSTSGNSINVMNGIEEGMRKGGIIFGITGKGGGKMKELIQEDKLIMIPSQRTSFIQESTIAIGHIVSKMVEDLF